MLKTCGYLVSTFSVLLLGFVSWQSASEQPLLALCLIAGMASSIAGMFLRWLSHEADRKLKKGAVAQLTASSDPPAQVGASGASRRSAMVSRS